MGIMNTASCWEIRAPVYFRTRHGPISGLNAKSHPRFERDFLLEKGAIRQLPGKTNLSFFIEDDSGHTAEVLVAYDDVELVWDKHGSAVWINC